MKKFNIKHHAKVMFRGFCKMLYGAAMAGLVIIAIYGYSVIPSEDGYVAVADFLVSTATMAVALISMYAFGCRKGVKG